VRAMLEIGQQTVFREPQESGKAARIVAAELHGRVELLDPLDSEFSEAGKSYLERMEHDLGALERALAPQSRKAKP